MSLAVPAAASYSTFICQVELKISFRREKVNALLHMNNTLAPGAIPSVNRYTRTDTFSNLSQGGETLHW